MKTVHFLRFLKGYFLVNVRNMITRVADLHFKYFELKIGFLLSRMIEAYVTMCFSLFRISIGAIFSIEAELQQTTRLSHQI